MGRFIDLTGERFGRLIVSQKTNLRAGKARKVLWECVCDCGNLCYLPTDKLKSGHTSSCGCYAKEIAGNVHRKHGKRNIRIYNIWSKIKGRCNNPDDEAYRDYGGRGIKLCEEWHDFVSFYKWAMVNGYADNLTIDRIDNDQGYSPNNCRWTTAKEQSRNRRNNRYITCKGETHILEDWAAITGISKKTIHKRLKRGWSEERSVLQGVSL